MRKISMSFAKEALYNAFRFVINVGFIFLFQMMFHAENTLTAVALSVGFTMLPNSELHIRPGAMCCIVLLLYIGGGIAAQSALLHPALAFLINFWFLVLLLALISEPMEMKANISFLLCFVFSQSTYVPWTQFPARLACVSFGALLICGCIVLNWKRKGKDIGLDQIRVLGGVKARIGLGNEAAGLAQPLQQRPPLGILRPLPSFPQEKHSGLLRHNGASFVFGFPSHGMSSLDKYAEA